MFYSQKKFLIGLMLVATAGLPILAAAADSQPQVAGRSTVVAKQAIRARLASGHVSAFAAGVVQANELVANDYRAYPASCLSYPLPTSTSGILFGGPVTLYATDINQDSLTENVTITIWRVACGDTNGALPKYNPYTDTGGPVSATLMRIQRSTQNEGSTKTYPLFPDVRIAQGSIVFDNLDQTDLVRVAPEPNTVVADTTVTGGVFFSTTYVLENYPDPTLGYFYFNNAFQIRFGYLDANRNPVQTTVFSISAYVPTQTTYPAAFQPLPINGYMTGSWYDPAHPGEGILTQILESSSTSRIFVATWYTYDQSGLPFWMVAQGGFSVGDTQVQNVPLLYSTGGGFAGNFVVPLPQTTWGTMNVSFADCNTMNFSYAGPTSSPIGAPLGSGTLKWSRIGTINSLTCQ